MNDFNKILLVGIFVLLSIQLFTTYNNKDIGRYELHRLNNDSYMMVLIDTKDGHLYKPNGDDYDFEFLIIDEIGKGPKKMKWEMVVEKEDIDHKVVEKEGIDYNATKSIH
jgi:hypothetical protein